MKKTLEGFVLPLLLPLLAVELVAHPRALAMNPLLCIPRVREVAEKRRVHRRSPEHMTAPDCNLEKDQGHAFALGAGTALPLSPGASFAKHTLPAQNAGKNEGSFV